MLVDDHLVVGLVVFLLDHGGVLIGLAFLLDHRRAVMIMGLAYRHARTYGTDANTNARIVGIRGGNRERKAGPGRQSNCKFHFSSSSVCPLHQFDRRHPVPGTKLGQRLEPFVEWTLPSLPSPVVRQMNSMPRQLRTAAAAAILCWVSPALAESITVGGTARTFVAQLPAAKPAPLVIVLHGNAQTGEDVAARTSWPQVAKREKFAVVFPDGLNRAWADLRPSDTRAQRTPPEGTDDAAFISKLVDKYIGEGTDDPKRI